MQSTVTLRANRDYDSRLPPEPLGRLLFHLPKAVFRSVRMRFEGRSSAAGRPPGWLSRAADIRVTDVSGRDDAKVVFDCPRLGTAAKDIYDQEQLWATRPDPSLTAIDVLCDAVDEVARGDADSPYLDEGFLNSLRSLQGAISNGFACIEIPRPGGDGTSIIDEEVIEKAVDLRRSTPQPARVRVAGELDMIRASTGAFAVLLDCGEELPGVRVAGDVTEIRDLLGQRVLVSGEAVFRPSGNVQRVEADSIVAAPNAPALWSELPRPREPRIDRSRLIQRQGPRSGVSAIMGAWPGDETDEEIAELLEEIS